MSKLEEITEKIEKVKISNGVSKGICKINKYTREVYSMVKYLSLFYMS